MSFEQLGMVHTNTVRGSMRMRCSLTIIGLALLVGCADAHKLTKTGGSDVYAALKRQSSAYVAVSQDGRYGETTYSGSGAMTAQIVAAAFAPYLGKVTISVKTEDVDQALASAKAGGFSYLLYPQILHWEDRATEWSAKPDVVAVKLSILATATGEVIDSAMVEGRSGLATFGGDKPQDLLPKPIGEYATSLFK